MADFSFVILTYNEEIHLPRLLKSIINLNAPIYILDSGSTDDTINIALNYGAIILFNQFENHPSQWDFALKNFNIQTPWIIGLDSDHIISPELHEMLLNFRNDSLPAHINGIYFNRKNYFKGKWLKHGGYFPKYLLKMFRRGKGKSDLNENMDHRFIIVGESIIWKNGYLIEENLKESHISFWIAKHNRYSDLVAQEELERRKNLRVQSIKPSLWGSPDQKIAWLKSIWWKLPLFIRPFLYFFHRYFIQLGILDGTRGFIFHFLQAFWFRLVVDIKMYELLRKEKGISEEAFPTDTNLNA
jgi:glycosyltransferase involved in cell wall biosynthesis